MTYNLQHSRSNTEPPMASRRGESLVRIPYWQTSGKPGGKGLVCDNDRHDAENEARAMIDARAWPGACVITRSRSQSNPFCGRLLVGRRGGTVDDGMSRCGIMRRNVPPRGSCSVPRAPRRIPKTGPGNGNGWRATKFGSLLGTETTRRDTKDWRQTNRARQR